MLKAHSLEEWKTYLRWQMLHGSANGLSEAFVKENFDFTRGRCWARRSCNHGGGGACGTWMGIWERRWGKLREAAFPAREQGARAATGEVVKMNKLQKKILIILIYCVLLHQLEFYFPLISILVMHGANGRHRLLKNLSVVPKVWKKYSDVWKAPLLIIRSTKKIKSIVHQSGYYIVSGIIGATLTYIVMLLISRVILRNGK